MGASAGYSPVVIHDGILYSKKGASEDSVLLQTGDNPFSVKYSEFVDYDKMATVYTVGVIYESSGSDNEIVGPNGETLGIAYIPAEQGAISGHTMEVGDTILTQDNKLHTITNILQPTSGSTKYRLIATSSDAGSEVYYIQYGEYEGSKFKNGLPAISWVNVSVNPVVASDTQFGVVKASNISSIKGYEPVRIYDGMLYSESIKDNYKVINAMTYKRVLHSIDAFLNLSDTEIGDVYKIGETTFGHQIIDGGNVQKGDLIICTHGYED